jgi:ATP-binding cassette subfamily B protein
MRGRTALVVAHRLSTIGLADRVVLLDGGRVVAEGRHDDLSVTSDLYRAVLAQASTEESQAGENEHGRAASSARGGVS